MNFNIAVMSGDGIGPEIVEEAKRYLKQLVRSMVTHLILLMY